VAILEIESGGRLMRRALVCAALLAVQPAVAEQLSSDPFAAPIEASQGAVAVSYLEFATLPDADGGEAPRMMHMVTEPETKRLFVSTMRGMLYSLSYEGKQVEPYLDVNDAKWGIGVQFLGPERGLQSIAFHPQFARRGSPGYGKLYTYTDTVNTSPKPDFAPTNGNRTHDTVLLEWTAKDPAARTYDGGAPKELFRAAHPFPNHNGGQIAFNPLAKAGDADFGLLYVGFADGGAGGDPMNLAQNLSSAFGKILRIDPLGTNSANGRYGIPASNAFASDAAKDTLGEIFAYGVRNPQRFAWDPRGGRMLVADIGQNQVEEISPVTSGANLGWVKWEGSYKYVSRQVDLEGARGETGLTWPLVEFDHSDPILQRAAAITGLTVYRDSEIKALSNRIVFGDIPSGEIFHVPADEELKGGTAAIRRVLLKSGDKQKTLLEVINDKLTASNKRTAPRVDLRFGFGPKGQIFLLNKRDGVIRLLVPDGTKQPKL
jgi:glucose/arabinose dehydrogenase